MRRIDSTRRCKPQWGREIKCEIQPGVARDVESPYIVQDRVPEARGKEHQPDGRVVCENRVVAGTWSLLRSQGCPRVGTPAVRPCIREVVIGTVWTAVVVAPEHDESILALYVHHSPIRALRWLCDGGTWGPGVVARRVGPDISQIGRAVETAHDEDRAHSRVVGDLGVGSGRRGHSRMAFRPGGVLQGA